MLLEDTVRYTAIRSISDIEEKSDIEVFENNYL